MDLIGFEQPLVDFIVGIYSSVVDVLGADLTNFFIMALGIAVYGIILGTFYKNFSREKFFILESNRGDSSIDDAIHVIAFILKYTLAFPIITFVWFMFLSLFLIFLGSQGAADVMFVAIAVVAATRMSAYWDEGIAEDLAKMLPLGLLAYFISNPAFLDAAVFEQKILEISQVLPLSFQYLFYIIVLEWVLRICVCIKDFLIEHKKRIVPAPILSRIPQSMPEIPRKVTLPRARRPSKKVAEKTPEKPEKPKAPEKKGKKSEANWDLEG